VTVGIHPTTSKEEARSCATGLLLRRTQTSLGVGTGTGGGTAPTPLLRETRHARRSSDRLAVAAWEAKEPSLSREGSAELEMINGRQRWAAPRSLIPIVPLSRYLIKYAQLTGRTQGLIPQSEATLPRRGLGAAEKVKGSLAQGPAFEGVHLGASLSHEPGRNAKRDG
jgi:hypothetical protein